VDLGQASAHPREGEHLFAGLQAGNAEQVAKKKEKNRLTSPISHGRAVPIGDYGFLSPDPPMNFVVRPVS